MRVFFDVAPDLIGVSVNTYAADANPDDAQCEVGHDPTGAGTANMTVVADLKAGATGNREILVSYEHLHTETDPDTIHTHEELNTKDPIGPVGPAGEELRVPVCIQE